MILLKNRQRKIQLDTQRLERDAQALLEILDYADFDIGILITTNRTIKNYNREYRHKDKPTDILSFPYHPELKAGKRIKVRFPEDKNLGDIIISAEYVVQEAQKYGVTLYERLQVLLVHGICHLLGYDHITDHDYNIMHAQETYLLQELNQ